MNLSSTSTRVKLTWRTAKNKKRAAIVKVRKGTAVKTLPKGSKKIAAQAKATKKLRTGAKTPIPAYAPPVAAPTTPPSTAPTTPAPPVSPPVEAGPVVVTVESGPTSAVSTGGEVLLQSGAIRVQAPVGAIAAGQSLTLTPLPDAPVGEGGVAGSAVQVTTSQGQPAAPVRVQLPVPAGTDTPGVFHQLGEGTPWVPEPSQVGGDGTVSAQVDHFSLLSVGQRFAWSVGVLLGNRSSEEPECAADPTWIKDTIWQTNVAEPIRGCPEHSPDGSVLRLHLINNRNRAQALQVNGATFDAEQSWWSTTLAGTVNQAYARALREVSGPQVVYLPPTSTATLVFHKPATQPADNWSRSMTPRPPSPRASESAGPSPPRWSTNSARPYPWLTA